MVAPTPDSNAQDVELGPKELSKSERSLPVALSGLVFLMTVLLLPTVLRPVDPLTNESAEFSPDAPPDENQESIVESLNRGTSATSGEGEGVGETVGESDELGEGEAPEAPPVMEGPASRGACFGSPPRQVESVYSPPCIPAFVGDNGGATAPGVTATEIRVAMYIPELDSESKEGPVDDTSGFVSPNQAIYLAFQNWFNENFELYGRQMRIFFVKQSLTSSSQGRAAAVRAKQQYDVFAAGDVYTTNPGTYTESMNQGIVTWTGFQNEDFLNSNHPHGWSFLASNENTMRLSTEVICKQLGTQTPTKWFNREMDPTFNYGAPRVYGLLAYEDSSRAGTADDVRRLLSECGVDVEHTIRFAFEDENATGVVGAMAAMRARGVTTILHYAEHASLDLLTAEATRLNYFPEWFVAGTGATDVNGLSQNQDQVQWNNAVGLSFLEIPRQPQFRDDVRAVRALDPGSNYSGSEALGFSHLFGIATGAQLAGPELTADTFAEGLFTLPPRPPDPIWSIAGGYTRGDHTYADYASLIWYDKDAVAADNGQLGSYRYLFDGQRFTYGEIPTDPVPWQDSGITTPADPTIPDTERSDVE